MKNTKNISNITKISNQDYSYNEFRKYSQRVRNDGNFYVNEKVGLISRGIKNIPDAEYIQATIITIIQERRNKFLYHLLYNDNNNKPTYTWASLDKISKYKDCDFRSHSMRAKYKVGDVLDGVILDGYCYESITIYKRTFIDNNYIYWTYPLYPFPKSRRYLSYIPDISSKLNESEINHLVPFYEEEIKTGKKHVDHLFKKGDKVCRKNTISKTVILYEVENTFCFDNCEKTYLKILHKNRILFNCEDWYKYKEPLRIFSEIDPYGEEDWSCD